MRKWLLTVALCLSTSPALAQGYYERFSEDEDNDFQIWPRIAVQYRTGNLRMSVDSQPRFAFNASRIESFQVRSWLGYQLGGHCLIQAAHFWTPRVLPQWQDQQRIVEQVTFLHRIGKLYGTSRTRCEQRFIEGVEGVEGCPVRLRQELLLGAQITPRWNVFVSEEPFWQVNTSGDLKVRKRFGSENRAVIGVGYRLNEHWNLQAGYMNQFLYREPRSVNRFNHVLFTNLTRTF